MLKRFIENVGFKKVPHTSAVYEISCSGILRETVSKRNVSYTTTGEGEVIIPPGATGEWFDGLSLAVILGVTYRNCLIPIRLLSELEVLYKDGDVTNHKLTNFIWACPKGKLSHPLFDGFCYIPGFSRYLINSHGDLLSVAHGDLLSPYYDKSGYLMYGVQPDVGKRTIIGMHRLIMLAYTEYSASVDRLDVNHLDTVKDNNTLSNLEWASRQRNSMHAHENGLNNSLAVLVRDISTDEVVRYHSIEETSRAYSLNGETIRQRLLRTPLNVYDGKYQFKYEGDDFDWTREEEFTYIETSRRIAIESIATGNILVKNSLKDAAQFFNVTAGAISYHLSKSKHGVVYKDYLLKYLGPLIPK